MQDNLYRILEQLLKFNNFSFDKEQLKLQIKSHPSYPSLHSVTGVLDHFSIDNLVLDVPINLDVFNQLPDSFIAQIKTDKYEDLVLVKKKKNGVVLYISNKKKQQLSVVEFLKQWTGIVVVVEKEESKKYDKYNLQLYVKVLIMLIGGVALFSFIKYQSFSAFGFYHFIFSLLGLFVSYLLVKRELGFNSYKVDKLCSVSERTSCDAVLFSKGANFLGLFKLSDISFVYFLGLSLNWVLLFLSGSSMNNLITILSLIMIPVILYSVSYQAFIVKKWCPLCLATSFILLIQVISTFIFNSFQYQLDVKEFLFFISSFAISTLAYGYFKSIVETNIKLKEEQIKAYKFKRNISIFKVLYNNNSILDTEINNLQEIQFGNPNALFKIVLVTNPLCGYCKLKHQTLDGLLLSNAKDVFATIRFNINTEQKENPAYVIANILLNIYNENKLLCQEAIQQIYSNGVNVEKWIATYKMYAEDDYYDVLEAEKKWCTYNNINFTPAVYLNDSEYPKEYDLSDLPLFMDELIVLNKQIDNSNNILDNEKIVN
jgi:uncharacterized membrane protein/RNA polymerase subunit RPABC4/transcription elongation factor Spt4